MGCHAVLQGICPTQGSNPGLPYRRQIECLPSELTGKPTATIGWPLLASRKPLCNKEDPAQPKTNTLFVVQSLSPVRLSVTPWTAARQASPSFANSQSLLKFMSIKSVMPSNHLILCHLLLLLPSIFPRIRVFSNESALPISWPKDWSFSFSISPSNKYSGLISFRMDWLDLLAVQGTLKSLLQ